MPSPRARQVDAIFANHDRMLLAPDHIDLEVLSTLRRWRRRALVSDATADRAARRLRIAPIDRWPCTPLAEAIWAWRDNLTPYVAAYVALATYLRCPLLTLDVHLAGAPRLGIEVVTLDQ